MYVRRKVYSYNEPEEQLYSVVMSEEELDLFSDFCEELEALYSVDDEDIAKAAGIGGAAAAVGGLGYAGYKEGKKLKKAGKAMVGEARHALAGNKYTGKVVKESIGQKINYHTTRNSGKTLKSAYKDLMKTKSGKAALAAAAAGTAISAGAAGYGAYKKNK